MFVSNSKKSCYINPSVSQGFQKAAKESEYAITFYFFCLKEMNSVFQLYSSLWGRISNALFMKKELKLKC